MLGARDLLQCPCCTSANLDFSNFNDNAPTQLEGEISCLNCNTVMRTREGVLDAIADSADGRPKLSATDRRIGLVYKEFWNRGGAAFSDGSYSDDFERIQDWRHLFESRIVLDAGCGSGRFIKKWIEFGPRALIFVDLSDAIFEARKNFIQAVENLPAHTPRPQAVFIRASVKNLPLKNLTVDLSWSSGVLALVDDQKKALSEILRVSKADALVGVLSRNTAAGRLYFYLQPAKTLLNQIERFDFIYGVAGFLARVLLLSLKTLSAVGLSDKILGNSATKKILNDPNAAKRLQLSLYDPLLIPYVKKYSDDRYFEWAEKESFQTTRHTSAPLCEYYQFSRLPSQPKGDSP